MKTHRAVGLGLRLAAAVLATSAIVLWLRPPVPLAAVAAPPGAAPHPPALQARLRAAQAAESGPPRTRHRHADGSPLYTNRLVLEPSPYLRQHAHNPVDWYPWGDEAFARALAEGKPVLLSIGYSTCHWCHVMEEESFEDPEIAEYLNRHYIAVKVDRERRPDVDGVYMQAVQLMGERGGWPLTVWLTPGRQPFYGGTYFPARDGERGVRMGFLTVLRRVHEAFVARPGDVATVAADLTQQIRAAMTAPPGAALPDQSAITRAVEALRESYDAANGGFGGAPKFPRPVELELLLRQARRAGDAPAQAMAMHTLAAMAAGGIRDQLGGGFHRYATDARWLVPHFEKMLYDNALLAIAYLEAYQASGDAALGEVARDILAYVARDMTAPSGAFYSASDADSEGEEGTYFLWTPEHFAAVLPPDDARLAAAYYALGAAPLENGSVLYTPRSVAEVAAELGVEPAIAERRLATARAALAAARRQRVPPATDRKILPAWNGLMISAFARAAFVFDDEDYARQAARAADAVLRGMLVDGRLRRSSLDGVASGDAYLDDYAAMIVALLDLYEATAETRWLAAAVELERIVDGHYRDAADGGYFLTAADAEPLLAREKPAYDGAEPSGTSTLLLGLLRLHEMTGEDRYRARAEDTLRAAAPVLADNPLAMPRLLAALDFWLDRPKQIVVVAPEPAAAEPFLAQLRRRFLPNRVLLIASDGNRGTLAELAPIVADKVARDGKATAYVCERRVCDFPTTDPSIFARQLEPR